MISLSDLSRLMPSSKCLPGTFLTIAPGGPLLQSRAAQSPGTPLLPRHQLHTEQGTPNRASAAQDR